MSEEKLNIPEKLIQIHEILQRKLRRSKIEMEEHRTNLSKQTEEAHKNAVKAENAFEDKKDDIELKRLENKEINPRENIELKKTKKSI